MSHYQKAHFTAVLEPNIYLDAAKIAINTENLRVNISVNICIFAYL